MRKTWQQVRLMPHDASSVDDPARYEWYKFKGVWYPDTTSEKLTADAVVGCNARGAEGVTLIIQDRKPFAGAVNKGDNWVLYITHSGITPFRFNVANIVVTGAFINNWTINFTTT